MLAALIDNPGLQSRLLFSQQEKPQCTDEQLLIKVKATAINRADLLQRQGKYPPPAGASLIPGLEIAGEIVKLGSKVSNFKLGEGVYALVSGGGYAEYCVVDQGVTQRIPKGWTYVQAAALPEALVTAHATIFLLGQLEQNQTLLIHAAGSGISSLAIQMAKLIGAKVISTVSTTKMTKAKHLGLTKLINYQEEDFEAILGEQSLDLIIDYLGGDNFSKHLRLLKTQGKLIQLATMQGYKVNCDLALIMRKRLQINGFVLRGQTLAEKRVLWKLAQQQWSRALNEKLIFPVIDSEFSFKELEQAHARMQGSEHFGKIVIRVGD